MAIAVMEVRYEGGLVLTERVFIEDSSGMIVSPRISDLLDVLDKTEPRMSMRVKYQGVVYRVQCKRAGRYMLGPKAGLCERWISNLQTVTSPGRAQRRLNGRFAHLLSACSLIGTAYLVLSTKVWSVGVLVETATLLFLSVSLYVIGHVFFSDDDGSK